MSKRQEAQTVSERLQEQDAQLQHLRGELDKRQQTIERLEVQLQERHETIQRLEDTLTDRDAQIDHLETRAEQAESSAIKLRTLLDTTEQELKQQSALVRDDLKVIHGIGTVYEQMLNDGGIHNKSEFRIEHRGTEACRSR